MFNKQKRHVTLFGTKSGADGTTRYTPLFYDASVEYSHKSRHTHIVYDDSIISTFTVTPVQLDPLDLSDHPGAIDPLSFIIELVKFAASDSTEPYISTLFDGKRLNKTTALPLPDKENGKRNLSLSREPIAGYTAEKVARWKKGEPPVLMEIYPKLSHFPHSLSVDTNYGALRITRVKEE